MELMPEMPDGWEFLSADFSMKAMNRALIGGVMLVRDEEGRDKWHSLPPDLQEKIDLYVSGTGTSVAKAMASAAAKAVMTGFEIVRVTVDPDADLVVNVKHLSSYDLCIPGEKNESGD